jgi:oligopeptidase B
MNTPELKPPVAPRKPFFVEAHGDKREDDLEWLRYREDPQVIEHLTAENTYTDSSVTHLEGLRERLFEEIKSRIEETDLSVPVRKGPWWYLTRTTEGLSYPILSRVPVDGAGRTPDVPPMPDESVEGPPVPWPDEKVLLDENKLAEGEDYLALGVFDVSPGHELLAYATDTSGSERFTLRFKDLSDDSHLPDSISEVTYGSAWANDDTTFFYVRADAANRPHQIWVHRLGTDPSDDTCVLEEPDERFHLEVRRTKDGDLIVAASHSKLSSEVQVVSADRPMDGFRIVEARRENVEYDVDHNSGVLLMLTNDQAPNFRLLASQDDTAASDKRWIEVIGHRPDVRLEGIEVFDDYLACAERLDGMPRIRLHDLGAGTEPSTRWSGPLGDGWLVPVDEIPSASWIGPNPEPGSTMLRYEYSSLITPRTVLDLDLTTRDSVVRKRQRVLGDYDPTRYESDRLWAKSPDGTMVPISVVSRRDTPKDGTAPCVVYGYGAYEVSIDPIFSSIRLSLLDRGFVYAIAHIRGGGELGRRWYDDGKMLSKPNTFIDFVSCARHLVEAGWASSEMLVARGASAGGLTVGAAVNLDPGLFRFVDAHVPFVDCVNTMLDPTLPLTVTEWDEWGNPLEDPEIYATMKAYSPYDNVKDGVRYPDVLATGGLSDPRVGYWEPAKWVQKLREASPGSRILLRTEMGAGHGGPSGRYDSWKEEALSLACLLDSLGLAKPGSPQVD